MATATKPGAPGGAGPGTAPRQASLVLLALIVVANLNLTVANVALPDIGRAFDTGQTTLDLIAIGYSLGLAGSVLYLGAVGRYPQYASKITAAAKSAFLSGDQWAYTAAIIGVVLGAALVFFMYPRQEAELALLVRYQAEDRQ